MSSNHSCNTPHVSLKPRIEQEFARLEALFPIRLDRSNSSACLTIRKFSAAIHDEANRYASNNCSPECKSQALHSSVAMIERADRSSEPARHGNRHQKQSGRARSPQSSKEPRR
jgi:hypothetical protein